MLITVSTILEAPETVLRWVGHNLAGGVDHMVVFLDQPDAPGQDEVWGHLVAHPHTTPVRADAEWWGTRSDNLNLRQAVHANAALHALSAIPEVEWVFHMDGDEVLDVDRAALRGVPNTECAVLLEVLESVTDYDLEGWSTQFKRVPTEDELVLLAALGVIRRPTMSAMIHGHALGKGGVRPGRGHLLGIHVPVEGDQRRQVAGWRSPELRVLHHYGSSGSEMIAKAARYAGAGMVTMGKPKQKLVRSVQALAGLELAPAERDALAASALRRTPRR